MQYTYFLKNRNIINSLSLWKKFRKLKKTTSLITDFVPDFQKYIENMFYLNYFVYIILELQKTIKKWYWPYYEKGGINITEILIRKKPSEDKECLDFLITQGVKLIILKEKISLLTIKIAEKGLTF